MNNWNLMFLLCSIDEDNESTADKRGLNSGLNSVGKQSM